MTRELDALVQRCESEKLHLSGAIQSHGALIRLDAAGRITHASANLAEVAGVEATALLGIAAADLTWLPDDLAMTGPDGDRRRLPALAAPSGRPLDGQAIYGADGLLIELEPQPGGQMTVPLQHYQSTLLPMPFTDEELAAHHRSLVRIFSEVTGFDRVMIYRFHPDWSGEVIAEATTPQLGSYLGLRFPASDIPAIARRIYMLNPSRLIPDARAPAVPLLGLDGEPPDLTRSDLRSVSPVHLEYLANMGVRGSFSVPVRVNSQLWGLVACHHLEPRSLPLETRNAAVSLTNSYALGVASHLASRRLRMLDTLDRRINAILEDLAKLDDPLDGIGHMGDQLMALMQADGFAMVMGDDVAVTGLGPDLDDMAVLDDWLVADNREMVFFCDRIEELFPQRTILLAAVAGMAAIKVRSARTGWLRLYWFRQPMIQEIAWAGNPNKPVIERAGVSMLSPRRSFEKWIEFSAAFGRPWSSDEKMIATKFRTSLLRWL